MKHKSWILFMIVLPLLIACNQTTSNIASNVSTDTSEEDRIVARFRIMDNVESPPISESDQLVTELVSVEQGQVTLSEIDPLEVEGNILIQGSSTVFPLTKAMYERFIREGYEDIMRVEGMGTGTGFELFCTEGSKSDIVNASRPVKDDEREKCAKISRTPIEFPIGTDALVVIVNPDNDFIEDVTLDELKAIFTVEKWSDVNASWPDERIVRIIPGENSGTFDFFVEKVFDEGAEPLLKSLNTTFLESGDEIAIEISLQQHRYAIGFVGYAFYQKDTDIVNALSIGGVKPSPTSNGSYPLSRSLYIYSDANIIQKKPQVAAFINFYLTHVNEEIFKVGYFPTSSSTLDQSRTTLKEAMKTK